MLIIKHRWHDLTQTGELSSVDGAEIDIRVHNGELIVEHDPFKEGPRLSNWLADFQGGFLIANVKEEGLEPFLVPMFADTSISGYFILDETVPFMIKHCKAGNPNFGIRVSKWEPVHAALQILEQVKPSPIWIWLDTFEGQIPFCQQEIGALIDNGAKVCLVSPELHPDYQSPHPTDEFMRSFWALGVSNFDAVCTKKPEFWNRILR